MVVVQNIIHSVTLVSVTAEQQNNPHLLHKALDTEKEKTNAQPKADKYPTLIFHCLK